jgi:4-diphosphocytidyl-2C-methyl-D-erythritol kinase
MIANFEDLNIDDFFESMDDEGLNEFESMYLNWLKYTTNNINVSTGQLYTEIELTKLHDLCNRNLKEIKKS